VLAATRNDAYNALVCTALAPEIGQRNVLQLAMGAGEVEEDPKALARPRRGGVAFAAEADFETLWRNLVRGWKFSKTRLSESYTYQDFQRGRGKDAMEVLIVDAEGVVTFLAAGNETEPGSGKTIVWFGPERPQESVELSDAEPAPA